MNRFLQTLGLLTLIIGLIFGTQYLFSNYQEITDWILKIAGGISIVVVIAYFILRLSFGKNWGIKAFSNFYFGKGLIDSTEQLITEVNSNQLKRNTVAQVVSHIIWRLTRIGIVGILIAGLPLWLLLQQNELIRSQNELFKYQNQRINTQTALDSVQTILAEKQTILLESQDSRFKEQNEKIDTQTALDSVQTILAEKQTVLLESQDSRFKEQNEKIDIQNQLFTFQNENVAAQTKMFLEQNRLVKFQNELLDTQNYRLNLQNNLIEAERRGALIILMSNIMDQMNAEIIKQKEDTLKINPSANTDTLKYQLSDPLIGRIASLSQGFLPYRYLEGDTLSAKEVSPERGQLLLALVKSNLDSFTLQKIYSNTNFNAAYLKGANLIEADLIGADLSRADLRWADLYGADLRRATLRRADLRGVDLCWANLDLAYLSRATLSRADLRWAYLDGADLSRADLRRTNLDGADLRWANLSRAKLSGVKNLNLEQLKSVQTLYQTKALLKEWQQQLKKEKPCLFTKEGCPKE